MMADRNPEDPLYPGISFMAVMNAADDVVRKKISADFKLTVRTAESTQILLKLLTFVIFHASFIFECNEFTLFVYCYFCIACRWATFTE